MKVAFDYDSTLDRGDVQLMAKALSKKGYEVWIVTSRLPDDKAPSPNWNHDLWFTCTQCDISTDRVIFTSYSSKHEFFWEKDFIFHLDDDADEVRMINAMCKTTKAINVDESDWKEQIKNLLTAKPPKE